MFWAMSSVSGHSDDWESVRLGFLQVRSECAINPPNLPAGRLTAIWTSLPKPESWRLNYFNGRDEGGFKERFAWLAESAAALRGNQSEGEQALWFWLDQLKLHAPKQYVRRITTSDDELYSIEILDICGLSAEFCRKCKADVLRLRSTAAPSRREAEQLAEESFALAQEQAAQKFAAAKGSALRNVAKKGNIGGYAPALAQVAASHTHDSILAYADAYVDAFTLAGVPLDEKIHNSLEIGALQIAGGVIGGVTGELHLLQQRTKRHLAIPSGSINRAVSAARTLALRECKLRLKRQGIIVRKSSANANAPQAVIQQLSQIPNRLNIPELPEPFNQTFEKARAKADLVHVEDSSNFPRMPAIAFLSTPVRIQKIFFAYCTEARNASEAGFWTGDRVRRAVTEAWPAIFKSCFDEQYPSSSEEKRSEVRDALWKTVLDDSRWKQHIEELVKLAEKIPVVRPGREKSLAESPVPNPKPKPKQKQSAKRYLTNVGRSIDQLRKECGWSFVDLDQQTALGKKLILGHVNKGKGATPRTLKKYATAFSKKLARPVTVAELETGRVARILVPPK